MKNGCFLCFDLSHHEKPAYFYPTAIMPHLWKTTGIVPRLWCWCTLKKMLVSALVVTLPFWLEPRRSSPAGTRVLCNRDGDYCPGGAGLNAGDKHPHHRRERRGEEGRRKQKLKQDFPESGILLTSCANMSTPDMSSVCVISRIKREGFACLFRGEVVAGVGLTPWKSSTICPSAIH